MTQTNPYQPPKSEVADVGPTDESELASRWERLGGAIVDGLLVSAVIFPIMIATGYWKQAMSGIQPSFGVQLEYSLLGLVVFAVLQGYFLQKSGQTIGKKVAGTRIVSVDENRILPFWRLLAVRQLPVGVVSQIPVIGPILSFVEVLFVFRQDKRCVHDLIAGTKVIKATAAWKTQEEERDA